MSKIKAKIIGNQVWTVENLTKDQFYSITGIVVPIKNDNWLSFQGKKCYKYSSVHESRKSSYLFDLNSAEFLYNYGINNSDWRMPTYSDLDHLFHNIDGRSSAYFPFEEVPINLRGTYGWSTNGTNKIGFNAYPNPTLNEDLELTESEISRWWLYNENRDVFEGFGLYTEDVLAYCGTSNQMALAVRLVMDLTNPRVEENIQYV
jgi:uncharacterized protein (TIGR02145 family)